MKTKLLKHSVLALALLWSLAMRGTVVIENDLTFRTGVGVSTLTTPNIPIGAGANRLLFCGAVYHTGIANPTATVSSATFNGTALTQLDAQRITLLDGVAVTELWFLKSPPNVTSTVVMNWNASVGDAGTICYSFTGANQVSTFGTVVKSAGLAVSVGSQSAAIVATFLWFPPHGQSQCLPLSSWPLSGGCIMSRSRFAGGIVNQTPGFASQLKFTGLPQVNVDWTMGNDIGSGSNMIGVSINP